MRESFDGLGLSCESEIVSRSESSLTRSSTMSVQYRSKLSTFGEEGLRMCLPCAIATKLSFAYCDRFESAASIQRENEIQVWSTLDNVVSVRRRCVGGKTIEPDLQAGIPPTPCVYRRQDATSTQSKHYETIKCIPYELRKIPLASVRSARIMNKHSISSFAHTIS